MIGKIVLLTGGTGFVGSFLAVELLRKGHLVIFLARGRKGLSAKERIDKAVNFVDPKVDQYYYRVIEGDITQDGLGLSPADKKSLLDARPHMIFHSAGSVDFSEKNKALTNAINYMGTANVLQLAEEVRVQHFHHMSTLYVAGDRRGHILESELLNGQNFNNAYEETKAKAEELVCCWSQKTGIPNSIYRLPIVIGDSSTGKTLSFTGFYGFFKPFWSLRRSIRERWDSDPNYMKANGITAVDGHVFAPLFITCSDKSRIDLVPIDWITKTIYQLSERSFRNSTYHLSHPKAPTSTSIIKRALPLIGFMGLQFNNLNDCGSKIENLVHGKKILTSYQKVVDSITKNYFAYTINQKEFSNSDLLSALEDDYSPPPDIDERILRVMINYAIKVEFQPHMSSR